MTEQPIKQNLQKLDLTSRMVAWAAELSEFDLKFERRTAIKGQILVDFIAEMVDDDLVPKLKLWSLHVDGFPTTQGSGAGVTLESSNDIQVKLSMKFEFQASNNQAKYEVLCNTLVVPTYA